jgi:serine/threonine-protein kinase
MGFVTGESLESVLNSEGVLTGERAINIFIQIAEALVHAHEKGIVHRDLKPSNVLLTKHEHVDDFVKLVDFGIAKIADSFNADKTKLTQTGELIGTPLYMSPEQCHGDELDARSDLYSLGCVMYETISGSPPFDGENAVRVLLKQISDEPAPLPKMFGISADLKEVIMRCLEKDSNDRYQ